MSQDDLARQLRIIDDQGATVKTKYTEATAASGITPRFVNGDPPHRKLSTDEA